MKKRRGLLTIITVVVVVLAAVGAYLIGRSTQDTSNNLKSLGTKAIEVTAIIDRGVVDSANLFAGAVTPGATSKLVTVSTGQPVVSRSVLNIGDDVGTGTVLGFIAGVPHVSFIGQIPLYRDLQLGDKGDDVKALQQSLITAGLLRSSKDSGTMDSQTWQALTKIFLKADYRLTDVLPQNQLVVIPAAGKVTTRAETASTIKDENPLVKIQTSPNVVVFRVDLLTADKTKPETKVNIRAGNINVPAAVTNIGPFNAASNGKIPGKDITVFADTNEFRALTPEANVSVTIDGETGETTRVPLSAIRRDTTSEYVIIVATDGSQHQARVKVTRSGGGWAAITDETTVKIGDKVIVSRAAS